MIAVLVCILLLLDFALYPCTFMRNDVHAVANNTYDDVYMGTSHGKNEYRSVGGPCGFRKDRA